MKNPNSQVSGIAHNDSSLLSEPTDIRKWFSSYTYESPVLDSNEGFCISPTKVVADSEDEEVENSVDLTRYRKSHQSGVGHRNNGCHSVVPESVEEVGKADVVHDAEIPANPAYLDSISIPSEPPNIANWFSSYAYESPDLCSADFDVSLSPKHTFGNSEKANKENKEHSKELTPAVEVELLSCRDLTSKYPKIIAKPTRPSIALKRMSEGTNFSSENYFFPESVPCPSTGSEIRMPLVQDGQETNKAKKLTLSANDSYKESFPKGSAQVSDTSSGWIQLNRKPSEVFSKRSKRDEKQYKCAENDENSPQKLSPNKCKTDRTTNPSSSCGDKGAGALTREVFKETTNTRYRDVQEDVGKWRCPQKSKPYVGPPLKQLRLERWVHRI